MRSIAPAKPIAELLETEWQAQVVGTKTNPGIARMVGWKAYHTLRSRGSEAGYPDWSLFRDRHVYLELKTETGKVSDAQKDWIRAIVNAGVEVYVARPRHLEDITAILAARRDPIGGHLSTPRAREAEQQLLHELRKEIR